MKPGHGTPTPLSSSVSRVLNAVNSAHWLELDAEVLQAETPEQFRLMLAKIASAANLKASQIAVKSGIPRSQAYAMIKPSPVLPSKLDQVKAFLRVCNVAPGQIEEVLQLWAQLSEMAETATTSSVTGSGARVSASLDAALDYFEDLHGTSVVGTSVGVGVDRPVFFRTAERSAGAELVGLLRHVVSDERRTNRAMRLLSRVSTLQIPLLTFIAFLITRMPDAVAMWVAVVLSTLLVTALGAILLKFRQLLRRARFGPFDTGE